jgi:hypothetical protein
MIKKLLPLVVMAFLTACATAPTTSSGSLSKGCCETCSCCQSGQCGDCCKDGQCECCTDGSCPMCQKAAEQSAADEDKPCVLCEEAERKARAAKAKHGKMKH